MSPQYDISKLCLKAFKSSVAQAFPDVPRHTRYLQQGRPLFFTRYIMQSDNEDLHAFTDICLWFTYRCYKVLISNEQYTALNDGISAGNALRSMWKEVTVA